MKRSTPLWDHVWKLDWTLEEPIWRTCNKLHKSTCRMKRRGRAQFQLFIFAFGLYSYRVKHHLYTRCFTAQGANYSLRVCQRSSWWTAESGPVQSNSAHRKHKLGSKATKYRWRSCTGWFKKKVCRGSRGEQINETDRKNDIDGETLGGGVKTETNGKRMWELPPALLSSLCLWSDTTFFYFINLL